ncbi:MAG: dienelactone hydrolase family protein, partial [Chloroflexota bacterium]
DGACGSTDDACPLLFFLHGNTDNAHANLKHWQDLPNQGWVLAMPQSKNVMWAESYYWTDYQTTVSEVDKHYANLTNQYAIEPDKTIIAGFSMGGEMALGLALSGQIPSKGFILLGPGGPFLDDDSFEDWAPFIEKAQGRNLRGVILMGDADNTILHDNIHKMAALLNDNGIITQVKTFPDLKHEYPEDFNAVLKESLAFILN